jgi:hypothetical protein
MPPNVKFSSEDVDFLLVLVAALYHPLSIAIENRAVSIIGMKLLYTGHVHPRILYLLCALYLWRCAVLWRKKVFGRRAKNL